MRLLALAGAMLLAACLMGFQATPASAQGVGVYVGPGGVTVGPTYRRHYGYGYHERRVYRPRYYYDDYPRRRYRHHHYRY